MTILEENHHSLLIVEHDPLLYEDAERRMVEYLAQALGQTSKEATVLLYAPALDPHLQKIAGLADRVFCIYNSEQAPARGRKTEAKMPAAQRTLEAYSDVALEAAEGDRSLAGGKQGHGAGDGQGDPGGGLARPARRCGGDYSEGWRRAGLWSARKGGGVPLLEDESKRFY